MRRRALRDTLKRIGAFAKDRSIRLVCHPDQFVVLNSERAEVVENSIRLLSAQATILGLLGLPETPCAAITLHGGKGGREEELMQRINGLTSSIRNRLVLENDERAYGAEQILRICRATGVPMVFDAHHHLVKERLDSYDDPSIEYYTAQSAKTWKPKSFRSFISRMAPSRFTTCGIGSASKAYPRRLRLFGSLKSKRREKKLRFSRCASRRGIATSWEMGLPDSQRPSLENQKCAEGRIARAAVRDFRADTTAARRARGRA